MKGLPGSRCTWKRLAGELPHISVHAIRFKEAFAGMKNKINDLA
jgi:hypothetical protein